MGFEFWSDRMNNSTVRISKQNCMPNCIDLVFVCLQPTYCPSPSVTDHDWPWCFLHGQTHLFAGLGWPMFGNTVLPGTP
jgi:hypothetical protein